MEIQPPSPRRPSPNTLGQDCRAHFRVAARRQTAANFPALSQTQASILDGPDCSLGFGVSLDVGAGRLKLPMPDAAMPDNATFYADLPAFTPLGRPTMQKSPYSSLFQLNPGYSSLLPQGGRGITVEFYTAPSRFVSAYVGLCRNISIFNPASNPGKPDVPETLEFSSEFHPAPQPPRPINRFNDCNPH
jgi:hypothetical protein